MEFPHSWNAEGIRNFQNKLLRWYRKYRRDLPWRINPTPYRVWISEIMLQQTQAKTAAPYFERFLKQFPDVASLARASEKRVEELWAGLGYYRRARNLHKAARQIVRVHGEFPTDFEDILALPGIGRYTAGAICSLAFNQAQPVVDGNIRRVLIRLNGIQRHAPEGYYWNQMSVLLPNRKASSFNQAMMELGALVCIPTGPHCSQCPVRSFCKALEWNIQDTIPKARAGGTPKSLRLVTLLLEYDGRILLTSSGKPKFIPGKWGLPCHPAANRESAKGVGITLCRRIFGRAISLTFCGHIRHSITNYRIFVHAFHGKGSFAIQAPQKAGEFRWVSPSAGKKLLTSSLFRKVLSKAESFK